MLIRCAPLQVHREFDFAHKHPYLAPISKGDYSLIERFGAAKKTEEDPLSWYKVFVEWGKPCAWTSFQGTTPTSFSSSDCAEDDFYDSDFYFNNRCSPTDPFSNGNCGPRDESVGVFDQSEHIRVAAKRTAYETSNRLASPDIPICTVWPVYMYRCDGVGCFDGYLREQDLDPERDPPLLAYHPDYVCRRCV